MIVEILSLLSKSEHQRYFCNHKFRLVFYFPTKRVESNNSGKHGESGDSVSSNLKLDPVWKQQQTDEKACEISLSAM